jgi:hypothetical protein
MIFYDFYQIFESLRIGESITTNKGNGFNYLLEGWSSLEDEWVWSEGNVASIGCRPQSMKRRAGDLLLTIEGQAFVSAKHPGLAVEIFANGSKPAIWRFTFGVDAGDLVVEVPGTSVPFDGALIVTFVIDNPASPAELGLGDDPRRLGFALRKVSLVWAGNDTRQPFG